MPVKASAKKDLRQTIKRTERNEAVKNEIRYLLRQTLKSIRLDNVAEAEKTIKDAIKKIDKAAQKGILKKNTAARKKSRIVKRLNQAKTSK